MKNKSLSVVYWIHNANNWHKPRFENYLNIGRWFKVERIKTLGTPMLFAKDFMQSQDGGSSNDCNGNNTGVCAELNKVRSIPDLNKTDVIIQTHPNIWGKPNTNKDNTEIVFFFCSTK